VLAFLLIDLTTLALMSLVVALDASDAITQQARQRLEDTVRETSRAIAEDLRNKWVQLEAISQNTLIINGVVDTLGREAYLRPFVDKLSLPGRGAKNPYLAVLDYKGRLITANRPDHAPYTPAGWLTAVLQGQPQSAVFRDARGTPAVRLAFPIVYQQQVEGVLVSEFPLAFVDELLPADPHITAGIVDQQGRAQYGEIPDAVAQVATAVKHMDLQRFRVAVSRGAGSPALASRAVAARRRGVGPRHGADTAHAAGRCPRGAGRDGACVLACPPAGAPDKPVAAYDAVDHRSGRPFQIGRD
jgi:hypothetical protein